MGYASFYSSVIRDLGFYQFSWCFGDRLWSKIQQSSDKFVNKGREQWIDWRGKSLCDHRSFTSCGNMDPQIINQYSNKGSLPEFVHLEEEFHFLWRIEHNRFLRKVRPRGNRKVRWGLHTSVCKIKENDQIITLISIFSKSSKHFWSATQQRQAQNRKWIL